MERSNERCLGCGHAKKHHVKGIGLCLVASCGLCLIYRNANEPAWQLLTDEDMKNTETIEVHQGKTGMFYADCPTPGMTQTHRGETLYDLAANVQLTHGLDVQWVAVPR